MIKKIWKYLRRLSKSNKADVYANSKGLVSKYIKTGNVVVGTNSNIDQLSITIYGSQEGFRNVVIGKDCYLMGNIVLHQPLSTVIIGDRVFIGPNSTLFCYEKIEILNDVMISWGCTLIDTNAHSLKSNERSEDVIQWKKGWQFKDWSNVDTKPILVDGKCWIGFNSIITKGVVLNEGTVVACGSVVTKNTNAYSVVAGNPAQFIKQTE